MARLFERVLFVVFVCSVIIACEREEMLTDELINEPLIEVVIDYVPIENELLKLVNEHRLEMGLSELVSSGLVSTQAISHSIYMVQQGTVSHDNFDNRVRNLMNNASAKRVAENVAYGYATTSAFMNAWLNNESHRRAIEGAYTHFGISAKPDDAGRYYITQLFIER